jgi:hypothetical protein
MKVDRLSGLVIFMSIIGTLVVAGISVILFIIISISSLDFNPDFENNTSIIIWITLIPYIVDLLAMGLLRRIPFISYLLFPLFTLFDFLSLRAFYGRALLLFSSNVKRWPFRLGALIFTLVTFASTIQSLYYVFHWENFFDTRIYTDKLSKDYSVDDWKYADKRPDIYSSRVFIPSRIIENNFLTVGIQYKPWMDELIGSSTKIDSLKYVNRIFEVFINDSLYSNIVWRAVHRYDFLGAGLEGLVDMSNLPNGEHVLKIALKDFPEPEYRKIVNEIRQDFTTYIPFCKDVF